MPLDQELLPDARSYEQLRRALIERIPRYLPEWTDYNESDPGITLIELFAWLGEQLLFELGRVPERSYVAFLKLLGQELRPAIPATAYLSCEALPQAPAAGPRDPKDASIVPIGAQFGAQPPGGDMVIFEASHGIDLIRLPLSDLQLFDGASFTVLTPANSTPGATFRPFGWAPQRGSALYLGFARAADNTPAPFPPGGRMDWRVFLPVETPERRAIRAGAIGPEPVPEADLVWEYRPADDPASWQRLEVFEDGSAAFRREGRLSVQAPPDAVATKEGRVTAPCFWLRVRIGDRPYPAGRAPLIDFIRPNVVEVHSLATVREEIVGASTGMPNQRLRLQRRPVQPDSLALVTEGPPPAREVTVWERKDDLLASGRDDAHFVLNATAGELRFGDGVNGLIPVDESTVIARSYRFGGGLRANVEAGLIKLPLSALTNVKSVTNERRAVGGADEQSLADFLKHAPAQLRHRGRAVSADDYAALAAEVGGVGKAKALPLFHSDYPDVDVPGVVSVVLLPAGDEAMPRPSSALLEAVGRHLEPLRTLATELHLIEPDYTEIRVVAQVAVDPYASFDQVRNAIVAAINADLHPLGRGKPAGQGGARDFGQDFFPTELYSVIEGVEHVRSVLNLEVSVDERIVALNEQITLPPHGLVVGAPNHAITVTPYKDR